MGKRKEKESSSENEVDIEEETPLPLSRRNRTQRQLKKSRRYRDDSEFIDESPIQMKLKQQSKKPTNVSPTVVSTTPVPATVKPSSSNKKKKPSKNKDSGTSSEEERWLDAIESGKLEDVDDELKKIKCKDPKLMTARQRAMYDKGSDKDLAFPEAPLLALPTGYKEKVMTAEAIQKAALKSQKRKQLADEKREKDKKKTMERLLKKQDSKANKTSKLKSIKSTVPSITYLVTYDSHLLKYPNDVDFPLKPKKTLPVKPPQYCVMKCGNRKKYSCSKTGAPLCSFICYKKNLSRR